MPWHSIRGHDRVIAGLRRASGQGRLPHAFLFVGPEGIGKHAFAVQLAQALLCERNPESALDPCGQCPGCQQVAAGTHPDVLRVARPEDKHQLPIRVIRDLCLDLGLKPMSGRNKVAIVDDADDLNDEAANAFLKTLEEPPPGSTLILIGTSAEGQLDTILSRCRVVRFDPLTEADLAALLLDQGIAPSADAATRLARLADGSVARARGLADPDLADFRRDLLADLASPQGIDAPALSRKIEAFVALAGKDSGAKRARTRVVAGELARCFRAAYRQAAGLSPTDPDDPDQARAVAALVARHAIDPLLRLADRSLEVDYHVRRNVNIPLILDAWTHDLGRLMAAVGG